MKRVYVTRINNTVNSMFNWKKCIFLAAIESASTTVRCMPLGLVATNATLYADLSPTEQHLLRNAVIFSSTLIEKCIEFRFFRFNYYRKHNLNAYANLISRRWNCKFQFNLHAHYNFMNKFLDEVFLRNALGFMKRGWGREGNIIYARDPIDSPLNRTEVHTKRCML